jgi:hypothetical protein
MRRVNDSEQKVTFIENLPELFDLESSPNHGLTSQQYDRVHNRIRETFKPSQFSGMGMGTDVNSNRHNNLQHTQLSGMSTDIDVNNKNDSSSRIQARQHVVNQENNFNTEQNENYNIPSQQKQTQSVQESFKHFNMPIGSPSCLDVAEHVSKCPICSKFYNTDKTIYIIAIITLTIICILLLKKVLDV